MTADEVPAVVFIGQAAAALGAIGMEDDDPDEDAEDTDG